MHFIDNDTFITFDKSDNESLFDNESLLPTAVFPQRFSFFTLCLVQWLNEVAPW